MDQKILDWKIKMSPERNKIANYKHAFFARMMTFAILFTLSFTCFNNAESATASNYINPATYNTMRPFMNEKMQTSLYSSNTEYTPDTSSAFARAATGSGNTSGAKLARSGTTSRTNSSTSSGTRRVVARSGSTYSSSGTKRVVARSGSTAKSATTHSSSARGIQNRTVSARSSRGDTSTRSSDTTITTVSDTSVSTSQCLADYRSCMDGYCERKNAAYNRCFCSDELANIDNTLRPEVENILQQIIVIKNGGSSSTSITDAELEDLWQDTFYEHTGTNDMASLNDALDIDWPDETDDSLRGQNAFLIGHNYCVQHLKGCFYMVSNLRDSYKSEISRDCTSYKTYLTNLKTAGEAVISQAEAASE